MAWQYHPVLVVFALGGLVSLVVAGYCWHYMQTHGRSYLVASIGLLGVNNAIWVFAATLKTASTDLTTSLLFYKLEFLGFLPNTAVAIVVALAYVGKDRWVTRRTCVLLGIVPAVFIILTLINPGHVMIVEPTLVPAQGIMAFEHEFPPLFSVYLAWLYGSILAAILIIIWGIIADRVPTPPALVAIVVLLLPLVTAVLKTSGIYPPGGDGINVAPAASALGISVLAVTIIRYPVFELVPIGRDLAFEVLTDGYLLVGPTGRVLDANPAAAELVGGHASTELKDRPVTEILPVYDELSEATPVTFETENRMIEIRRSKVTRQNQDAGDVLLLQDVTEKRQRKRELERKNERLDRFATTVSHDLRNPLNIAQLRLELAIENDDSEHLDTVSDALERMEILIEDVLTVARQGTTITEPESATLSSQATQAWDGVDTKEATLSVECDLTFRADTDRLQQLFANLFRNAIEHGGNDVTVRVGAVESGTGFYVADNGPGLPESDREEVFEFGYSTAEEGTGMGLAIVSEISNAHGWDIRVIDSRDGGARFEITGVDRDQPVPRRQQ